MEGLKSSEEMDEWGRETVEVSRGDDGSSLRTSSMLLTFLTAKTSVLLRRGILLKRKSHIVRLGQDVVTTHQIN